MRLVTVIRHVHFEDLGVLEDELILRGFAIRYVEAGVDALGAVPDLGGDLLVVLGGPIGVYQAAEYPFLTDEMHLIEARLARDLPTLGICLGAQLMACALGARVYPASAKEVGWAPIMLTEAGLRSPIRHLAGHETPVLHWHGDTFDLPQGATLLASTEICTNQAFSWKKAGLGLQFHPEVRATQIERWFIGHACELSALSMPALGQLRSDTLKFGPRLQNVARRSLEEWLGEIGLLESTDN